VGVEAICSLKYPPEGFLRRWITTSRLRSPKPLLVCVLLPVPYFLGPVHCILVAIFLLLSDNSTFLVFWVKTLEFLFSLLILAHSISNLSINPFGSTYKIYLGWEYSSVVEYVLSSHEVLGLIHSTIQKKKNMYIDIHTDTYKCIFTYIHTYNSPEFDQFSSFLPLRT
jgi:hypothetical protein